MYDPTKPYKKQILDIIKQTWETPHVSINEGIYPIIKKKFSYPEVDHTDGIGTKGIYHWKQRTFKNAVLDALAMNLNDLALLRAIPYKLQNHILIPEDDKYAVLEIIKILSEECKQRNIAISGGETSIHDNLNGLEISMTISGFIEIYKPNQFRVGDVLVGIGSSGLHSNGFTRVRDVFDVNEYMPEFVEPTNIYLDTILSLDKQFDIHGMMHITGGAFTKLKDLLYDANIMIRRDHILEPQKIFFELFRRGICDEEMYKNFNCGIGFVLGINKQYVEDLLKCINKFKGGIIGEVILGDNKVKIQSKFSGKQIQY